MSQRVRGQDVTVTVVAGGEKIEALSDIRSFEIEGQLEVIKEGYLGEPSDRRDDVYRGVSGRMDLHFHNADVFRFMRTVIDRAKRREPGTKINITATLTFDDGSRPRIIIPDVKIGSLPLNVSSRGDYASIQLSFEAEDWDYVSA